MSSMDLAEAFKEAGLMSQADVDKCRAEKESVLVTVPMSKDGDKPNLNPTNKQIEMFTNAYLIEIRKDMDMSKAVVVGVVCAEDRSMTAQAIAQTAVVYRKKLMKMMENTDERIKLLLATVGIRTQEPERTNSSGEVRK